jgi:hypothetical protein
MLYQEKAGNPAFVCVTVPLHHGVGVHRVTAGADFMKQFWPKKNSDFILL